MTKKDGRTLPDQKTLKTCDNKKQCLVLDWILDLLDGGGDAINDSFETVTKCEYTLWIR